MVGPPVGSVTGPPTVRVRPRTSATRLPSLAGDGDVVDARCGPVAGALEAVATRTSPTRPGDTHVDVEAAADRQRAVAVARHGQRGVGHGADHPAVDDPEAVQPAAADLAAHHAAAGPGRRRARGRSRPRPGPATASPGPRSVGQTRYRPVGSGRAGRPARRPPRRARGRGPRPAVPAGARRRAPWPGRRPRPRRRPPPRRPRPRRPARPRSGRPRGRGCRAAGDTRHRRAPASPPAARARRPGSPGRPRRRPGCRSPGPAPGPGAPWDARWRPRPPRRCARP